MRIVLLGDSHLARIRRDLDRLCPSGWSVVNRAVGGSFAADLARQAIAASLTGSDRVVVSGGTNDAAPWKQASLEGAVAQVRDFLTTYAGTVDRLVFLSSPGVDEARLLGANNRTNVDLARYSTAFTDAFERAGATVLDAARGLAPLGSKAFVDDGVHLSAAGYDVLLPALRTVLEG
ncbi:hypothetical protein ASG90_11140 [Nocardioides sp. Soil797]|nr:hypothetical protein ASG90_11140 [Nocardioides sp. Soil797]